MNLLNPVPPHSTAVPELVTGDGLGWSSESPWTLVMEPDSEAQEALLLRTEFGLSSLPP